MARFRLTLFVEVPDEIAFAPGEIWCGATVLDYLRTAAAEQAAVASRDEFTNEEE